MKKSYKKIIAFYILLFIVLLLDNSFFGRLSRYFNMSIFLFLEVILFKLLIGREKQKTRYSKDIIVNFIIVLLIAFIIYYIFGIFVGFARTVNYLNYYGLKTIIIPIILYIVIKEYLRSQILLKTDHSKILTVMSCVLFMFVDLTVSIRSNNLNDSYSKFIFFALTLLPVISNNITSTYVSRKNGYLPNIMWLLIINLYSAILPIVPNPGQYILALIRFIFPLVLLYNIFSFYRKREKNIPISYMKTRRYVEIPIFAVIVFFLAYFVSGYFRYHAIAVASGSMRKKIQVGDVVIVDHNKKYTDLKIGEVIAYKYNGVIVVHRLRDIVNVQGDYYFYTKGDANEDPDNYVVYKKNILGDVKFKIPYIGLPTVWLSKAFNKR